MPSVLRILTTFLIAVLAYSLGATSGPHARREPGTVTELLWAPLVWGTVLWILNLHGWRAFLVVGVACVLAARTHGRLMRIFGSRSTGAPRSIPTQAQSGGVRAAFYRLGFFQGRLMLACVYFLFMTPFALVMKVSRRAPHGMAESGWAEPTVRAAALVDDARRQY